MTGVCRALVLFTIGLVSCSMFSAMATNKEEDWFFDDLDEKIQRVNEGKLVFLAHPPAKLVHHHSNIVTLKPSSLKDGWVGMVQCHDHLDPVARIEIVFRQGYVRRLTIQSQKKIERAWVEGSSVKLKNVGENAQLCVQAESNSLSRLSDGRYRLQHGPFMRKFLDGYYPMRVSMDVKLPKQLKFISILPSNQQGFKVWQSNQGVHFDAWFEGQLLTELLFESK